MVALELGPNYGYVIGVGVGAVFLHHVWMGGRVMAARKKFNVKYPALYATPDVCSDEKARNGFNCVQRAHQNSLEMFPSFLFLLSTCGLKYPVTSAVLGTLWLLGRVLYFTGYSSGEPKKRLQGGIGYVGYLGLLITAIKFAYDLLV